MPNPSVSAGEQKVEDKKAQILKTLRFKIDIDETIATGINFKWPETLTSEEQRVIRFYARRIKKIKKYLSASTVAEVKALQVIEFEMKLKNKEKGHGFHILHPGSIEYGKWMYQSGMMFDLFSAGLSERNIIFFEKFIKLVVIAADPNLQVFFEIHHRENCFAPEEKDVPILMELLKAQAREYGIPIPIGFSLDPEENLTQYARVPKKRLECFKKDQELILVDNALYNIYPGEEQNSLNTNSTLQPEDFCIDFENKDKSLTLRKLLLLNNVFGIVGVKKTVLDMTVENGKSFSDNLFSLQFNKIDEITLGMGLFQERVNIYQPVDFFAPERFKYFEIGLKELQKINPGLTFYGQDLLYQFINEYKQNQEHQNYYHAAMGLA